jgi:iron complex outermembrane recepter protein
LSRFKNSFNGKAVYGQASYDLTDKLKVTAGIRYTSDKTAYDIQIYSLSYRGAVPGPAGAFVKCSNPSAPGFNAAASFIGYPVAQRFDQCQQHIENSTDATTWLLGLDYKPIEDVLLYAKWSRGYRQGGIGGAAPDTLQNFGAEKVDTYEVGAKTSWRGAVPGTFNISGFYNDFRNQQLQLGVECFPDATHTCVGAALTTTVGNIGKSRLYGFEAELGLMPFEGLKLHADYAYLNSKILAATPFILPADSIYNRTRDVAVGGTIPQSLPHKATISAEYTLPLPESVGKLSVGGTFVYQSRYKVSVPGAGVPVDFGFLPSSSYGNINVNWDGVGGMPVDLSFFITNVTNKATLLHVNEQSVRGFLSYIVAEPRMWGFRVKYRFGN